MRDLRVFGTVGLLAACMGLGSPAAADDAANGKQIYETYCATCHGLDGRGQGPMAAILLLQPPDLTVLTEKYDGEFPLFRVVTRIDGRDPLVSHGSPMPIFGGFFEGQDTALKTDGGQPVLTSQPVADLVAYLREVQE